MSECEIRSANSSSENEIGCPENEIGFPENEIGFPKTTCDLNLHLKNPNRSSRVSLCKYPLKKP